MPRIYCGMMMIIYILSILCSREIVKAQDKSSLDKKLIELAKSTTLCSHKITMLAARISAMENLTRRSPSNDEFRHSMIEACKDAVINDINNLAANLYQYRIRPAQMGGGHGSYAGYQIPHRMKMNDNGEYESVVLSDSSVILIGTSKYNVGTVKATVGSNGRLRSFEYTGEFL